MSIGLRLRQEIDGRGLTLADFSRITGVPYPTLMQYLADKRAPSAEMLEKICRQTNIDVCWLLVGSKDGVEDSKAVALRLSAQERELIRLFRQIEPGGQKAVLSLAEEKERLRQREGQLEELAAEYRARLTQLDRYVPGGGDPEG